MPMHHLVAVHMGAGYHSPDNEQTYLDACRAACKIADSILDGGGVALDAAVAAVRILEDCPLSNAGVGSNLTIDNTIECDASIMDGKSLLYGAAGAISSFKNPINVAFRILNEQKSGLKSLGRVPPSVLVGEGASKWAGAHGFPASQRKEFITKYTYGNFLKAKNRLEKVEAVDDFEESFEDTAEEDGFGSSLSISEEVGLELSLKRKFGDDGDSCAGADVKTSKVSCDDGKVTLKLCDVSCGANITLSSSSTVSSTDTATDSDYKKCLEHDQHLKALKECFTFYHLKMVNIHINDVGNKIEKRVEVKGYLSKLSGHLSDFKQKFDANEQYLNYTKVAEAQHFIKQYTNYLSGEYIRLKDPKSTTIVPGTDAPIDQPEATKNERRQLANKMRMVETKGTTRRGKRNPRDNLNLPSIRHPSYTGKDNVTDTVGVVVVDRQGNVASAVSSGGILLKHPGRIGSAATYGAGCWAENATKNKPGVAVATSGCGEQLMRTMFARQCATNVRGWCPLPDATVKSELSDTAPLDTTPTDAMELDAMELDATKRDAVTPDPVSVDDESQDAAKPNVSPLNITPVNATPFDTTSLNATSSNTTQSNVTQSDTTTQSNTTQSNTTQSNTTQSDTTPPDPTPPKATPSGTTVTTPPESKTEKTANADPIAVSYAKLLSDARAMSDRTAINAKSEISPSVFDSKTKSNTEQSIKLEATSPTKVVPTAEITSRAGSISESVAIPKPISRILRPESKPEDITDDISMESFDTDIISKLNQSFKDDFLKSSFLRGVKNKQGAALVLKYVPREVIDVAWVYNTASMCVGYMVDGGEPKARVCRLNAERGEGTFSIEGKSFDISDKSSSV